MHSCSVDAQQHGGGDIYFCKVETSSASSVRLHTEPLKHAGAKPNLIHVGKQTGRVWLKRGFNSFTKVELFYLFLQ